MGPSRASSNLPTSWTEDPDRCAAAGVPAEVGFATKPDGRRHQAKNLVALAGAGAWERQSAGAGAHDERLYDWAVLTLDATAKAEGLPAGWGYWLVVRREIDPGPGKDRELAFPQP